VRSFFFGGAVGALLALSVPSAPAPSGASWIQAAKVLRGSLVIGIPVLTSSASDRPVETPE